MAFEEATVAENKTKAMKKDLLVEEHRKRLAGKATFDEEVARLEEGRKNTRDAFTTRDKSRNNASTATIEGVVVAENETVFGFFRRRSTM